MAPDTSDSDRIVRVIVVRDAPTGECERYQLADGSWHKRVFSTPTKTGVAYGQIIDGRIRR